MNASTRPSGRLTYLAVLRFSGPDAANFLQGQVTNDLKALSPANPLLAAYLNPQGRVLALLHLLPHSSGILAILPQELVAPTAERMRKYVLRAKLKIDAPSESMVVSGYHDAAALHAQGLPVPAAGENYLERDGIGVARWGNDGRFIAVAAPNGAADAPERTAEVEAAWRLADIQAGMPQVYGATSEAFVAQMLNLDLLNGISFKKGCYTGQEIVARTQNLGRIKRRMFHLLLPAGAWSVGAELALNDGRHGRLTEVVGREALAVLNLEAQPPEGETPAAALTAAEQLPLPYTFA